jgi:hypothetical protein
MNVGTPTSLRRDALNGGKGVDLCLQNEGKGSAKGCE